MIYRPQYLYSIIFDMIASMQKPTWKPSLEGRHMW